MFSNGDAEKRKCAVVALQKSERLKAMGQHAKTLWHLERCAEDHKLRRAIAARLDRALQRSGTSSAKVAQWLGVTQNDVDFWRRGITVSPLNAFTRIAATLEVDVHWLCTGQTQRVHAVRP
jgi:predicted XRE-type DNA-binding protein